MDLPLLKNTKSIINSTISKVELSEVPLTTNTNNDTNNTQNRKEYNRISGYVDEDMNSIIINNTQ